MGFDFSPEKSKVYTYFITSKKNKGNVAFITKFFFSNIFIPLGIWGGDILSITGEKNTVNIMDCNGNLESSRVWGASNP